MNSTSNNSEVVVSDETPEAMPIVNNEPSKGAIHHVHSLLNSSDPGDVFKGIQQMTTENVSLKHLSMSKTRLGELRYEAERKINKANGKKNKG